MAIVELIALSGEVLCRCDSSGCAATQAPEEMRRLVDEAMTVAEIKLYIFLT